MALPDFLFVDGQDTMPVEKRRTGWFSLLMKACDMEISLKALVTLLALLAPGFTSADPGDPVAIRRWEGGAISIETMWNLKAVVDFHNAANDELKADADYINATPQHAHVAVHRPPNSANPVVVDMKRRSYGKNAITINKWHLGERGKVVRVADDNGVLSEVLPKQNVASAPVVELTVDGVSILVIDADRLPEDVALDSALFAGQTVIVLSFSDSAVLKRANVAEFIKGTNPESVLLNSTTTTSTDAAAEFQTAVASDGQASNRGANTFAVSASGFPHGGTQVITISDKPEAMPQQLADLFARMEKSCEDSQAVFEKLSVNQMNWKPSNGTHTPRWNTEHMMGRQLLFFSQIYNAIDPSIPVTDLNPKQMPKDYVFAHDDWSGAEEARQMERVSRFTRRFAYLIHDLDVSDRAPGSRWSSLKALLLQMEHHYTEHTANTVKKFDLEDWPQQ